MRFPLAATAAVIAAAALPRAAGAQTDAAAMGRLAMANQLGILEYCQGQGAIGPQAIAAEQANIARMPPASVSTDAAETAGKNGMFSMPNGQQTPLAAIAQQHGGTIAQMCQQMAMSVSQSSGAMQGMMPHAGAMPAMPGMAMPAMPSASGEGH